MALNSIPELLDELRNGRMVVVIDDEDRENEGDLIMAASLVTSEDINFMARYARGLICLPLTPEHCDQLQLPLMVNNNQARYATNFTVSIEAAEGVTTGISAQDRAHTIRTAVTPGAGPADLRQPGHVFPLMAQAGGVLTRAGHTEASVDLMRLAGLDPCAVLVEILNDDGSMARRPELEQFAKTHGLKIGTVADLIRYRISNERTVERVAEQPVETEFGTFKLVVYSDRTDTCTHSALVYGDINPEDPVLVRVHVPNVLTDLMAVTGRGFGLPLRVAFREVAENGPGVIVILGDIPSTADLPRRLEAAGEDDDPVRPGDSRSAGELRTYGIGAQILSDLGVHKMRVLSAPKRFHGLAGFGLEVVEYVEPDGD